ncbi:MAG: hypothetical protein ACI9JT_000992, partial [Polaribacter sp.]
VLYRFFYEQFLVLQFYNFQAAWFLFLMSYKYIDSKTSKKVACCKKN